MHLRRDDVDAVSMTLNVDGKLSFSLLLTRGGLTKRFGSSDGPGHGAIMVQGGTDSCFEDFLAAVPESLLERGGRLEDDGRDGPRHDWTIEFASGADTLTYTIGYHWGSASLPDEFADLAVRAESLTHSWYVDRVAEETGAPLPAVVEVPRPERSRETSEPTRSDRPGGRARPAPPVPAPRERIALAVLLDLFFLSIPYSLLHAIFVGGAEPTGPPGGALMLFAIVEFVLLQIARTSPGFWLLEISWAHKAKPRIDPARLLQESLPLLAVGVGLCGLGVGVLTAGSTYHTPVPYFGLSFPLWLSIPVTMIGSAALVLAGALVLRLDVRGLWLGAGLTPLMLLGSVLGWGDWPGFVGAAMGRPVEGSPGLLASLAPLLALAVLIALSVGLFETWKRLGRPPLPWIGSRGQRASSTAPR